MLKNILWIAISIVITLAITLFLFEIFPMEKTRPNHDLIFMLLGIMGGALAYAYMERVDMFRKEIAEA